MAYYAGNIFFLSLPLRTDESSYFKKINSLHRHFILLSFVCLFFPGTEKPECEPYWTIDDNTRRKSFTASRSSKNDYYLAEGWYRFISGKQMSTSCSYSSSYCDTSYAGWLQGSHPSLKDGVVSRKVCFGYSGGYGGNCCLYSTYIKMRNCGSFYVYKLKPTPNSNCRYCTEY